MSETYIMYDYVYQFISNLIKHICNSNQTSHISILVYLSYFDIGILFERKRDVMLLAFVNAISVTVKLSLYIVVSVYDVT